MLMNLCKSIPFVIYVCCLYIKGIEAMLSLIYYQTVSDSSIFFFSDSSTNLMLSNFLISVTQIIIQIIIDT